VGSIYRPKYKDTTTGEARESAIWWALFYVHGRRYRESTETTDYNEAKDFVKKREGQAASGLSIPKRAKSVTFADLAALEVNDYEKNERRSIQDLKIRFDKHILPVFGPMKANRIRPAEDRWLHRPTQDGRRRECHDQPGAHGNQAGLRARHWLGTDPFGAKNQEAQGE
jgi:hypothetical protein